MLCKAYLGHVDRNPIREDRVDGELAKRVFQIYILDGVAGAIEQRLEILPVCAIIKVLVSASSITHIAEREA